MNIYFVFVLGCMATFCLALFLTKTSGPGFIFRKVRAAPPKGSSAKEGLSCPWCSATWFAFLISLYQWSLLFGDWHDYNWKWFGLWWFATTAGAIIINQQWTKE